MKTPLILVGNGIDQDHYERFSQLGGHGPRRDYYEIAQRVDGALLGYDHVDALWYRGARRLESVLKFDLLEATIAFRRRTENSLIFSTSEKLALPLAMLVVLSGQELAHVTMAHKLSSPLKARLFQVWPLHKTFTRIITVCQSQANYAVHGLGISVEKVNCISHSVDQDFFRPLKVSEEKYILAVGREQRDYVTLLQALSGTNIPLVVVASSPWSSDGLHIASGANVTIVNSVSYHALRDLYAHARLVVLPLFDVDYAAGSTMLLEAMAMARPVIVSRSRGIHEYVRDGHTSVGVTPQNPAELRESILTLWEDAQLRSSLGDNARRAVEEQMGLDRYVERVSAIVDEVLRDG